MLLLCLTLAAVPALAQEYIMYENGPVNGQVNARMINFGSAVTDSFYNGNGLLIFSGFSFWVWMFPGDTLSSVEVSIGSTPYGTDVFHEVFNAGPGGNCFYNNFGYNVCQVSISFYSYPSGTAWLTLQNASVPSGNPVYWDQNSGVGCMSQGCPSKALQKTAGSTPPSAAIPSETFTITGIMVDRTH